MPDRRVIVRWRAGVVIGGLLVGGGAALTLSDSPSRPGCPAATRTLKGVYRPDRLRVLAPCRKANGVVLAVRREEDGDLHINVSLDKRFKLTNSVNVAKQGGALVVEFMARDAGHLPLVRVGDHVQLTGAWVNDRQHGWLELHPVFSVSVNNGPVKRSGPQFGGSPAGDRSSNAAEDCRTQTGVRCIGKW